MYQPLSDGTLHLLAIDLPLACILVAPLLLAAKRLAQRKQPRPYCSRRNADRFGCVVAVCRAIRDSTLN
jgi:hypothetical protein